MRAERVYRVCRKCQKEVNVSRIEPGGKQYVCPACAGEPWYMTRDWLCKGLWFEQERQKRKERKEHYEKHRNDRGGP